MLEYISQTNIRKAATNTGLAKSRNLSNEKRLTEKLKIIDRK